MRNVVLKYKQQQQKKKKHVHSDILIHILHVLFILIRLKCKIKANESISKHWLQFHHVFLFH